MPQINRTIIVERDSRALTARVVDVLGRYEGFEATAESAETAAANAVAAASAASTAAGEATAAATDALEAAKFNFATLAALLASAETFSAGDIVFTRQEGYAFEVVSSDPDLTTAGSVFLRAIPDADGFVHLEQYGAVPDGNRLTGAGTDNTTAIRRAFATDHNIKIGRGTFVVTDTIQNLKENRVVMGSGMGTVNSAPSGDWYYFNAPSCILAVGDAATRRVITRRNYRASAADPSVSEFC